MNKLWMSEQQRYDISRCSGRVAYICTVFDLCDTAEDLAEALKVMGFKQQEYHYESTLGAKLVIEWGRVDEALHFVDTISADYGVVQTRDTSQKWVTSTQVLSPRTRHLLRSLA